MPGESAGYQAHCARPRARWANACAQTKDRRPRRARGAPLKEVHPASSVGRTRRTPCARPRTTRGPRTRWARAAAVSSVPVMCAGRNCRLGRVGHRGERLNRRSEDPPPPPPPPLRRGERGPYGRAGPGGLAAHRRRTLRVPPQLWTPKTRGRPLWDEPDELEDLGVRGARPLDEFDVWGAGLAWRLHSKPERREQSTRGTVCGAVARCGSQLPRSELPSEAFLGSPPQASVTYIEPKTEPSQGPFTRRFPISEAHPGILPGTRVPEESLRMRSPRLTVSAERQVDPKGLERSVGECWWS